MTYHSLALAKSNFQYDLDGREFQIFFSVTALVRLMKFEPARVTEVQSYFRPSWGIMSYDTDVSTFLWQDRLAKIRTGEDLFKAMSIIGLVGRPEMLEKIPPPLFQLLRVTKIEHISGHIVRVLEVEAEAT